MKESINDSTLHRFLNKETSEKENDEILHWVSESEENRAEFRRIHQLFYAGKLSQLQSEIDVDMAWNKLNSQLPEVKGRSKFFQPELFRRIAAAVFILLAVGFGSIWTNNHFLKSSDSVIVKFEAPKGEKSKIVLADGSHVWLNSQTILTYDALNPRKVILQGEAYFEIEKDKVNPFEVFTTSGMKVVVTGTRFNLRCYASESYMVTTLEEGQVSIEGIHSEQLAALKPGQQAEYDNRSNQLHIRNVSPEIASLWKNNELRIADISFYELVPRIESWYGVSVKLDTMISRKDRFTMTVKTESLRELLDMMKLTSRFDYEINGEKIELYAK
jgi:ferric-dicitrate binding protein FerR (iron transport regulator)